MVAGPKIVIALILFLVACTHSVRLSVGPSVRPSVPLSFFSFFAAPAHPHATSARVYGLVFGLLRVSAYLTARYAMEECEQIFSARSKLLSVDRLH